MISIVVAMAKNNVIGNANDLPWYLPADLRHFKQLTTDHTVIMGRKTYESIVGRIHTPLPNRLNVVITRDIGYKAMDGVIVANTFDEAFAVPEAEDAFILGGAEVYKQSIGRVGCLYVTEIDTEVDGDVYFPIIDKNIWAEEYREAHIADDRNPFAYTFVTYKRS